MSGGMKDFEEFKRNLQSVERKLSTASGKELIVDVQTAISWIAHGSTLDPASKEWVYINREYLPNITRIMVNRKVENATDGKELMKCLEHVEMYALKYIGKERTLHTCLELLLDPQQILYQRLYNTEMELTSSTTSSTSNATAPKKRNSFLETLEVGTCIDYQNADGVWEMGCIEQFSEYRTELEVNNFNGYGKVWLSIERDGPKIAPFGTRAGFDAGAAPSAVKIEEIDESVPTSTTAADELKTTVAVDIDPSLLLTSIPPIGALVDMQDKNGVFYQVCILDHEEITISQPIVKSSPVTVAASEMKVVEPDDEASTNNAGEENIKNIVNATTMTSSPEESVIILPPPDVAPVVEDVEIITKLRLRASYIGFPESSDEWIYFDERKFARFNSISKGRHGDNRIRSEVKYLAHRFIKDHPELEDLQIDSYHPMHNKNSNSLNNFLPGGLTKFVYARCDSFTSQEYFNLVDTFCENHGLMSILDLLTNFQLERNNPSMNSNNGLSLEFILSAIQIISSMVKFLNYLHENILQNFIQQFLEISMQLMNEITIQEIRIINSELIENALNAIEWIIYEIYGYNTISGEKNEQFRLFLGLKYLLSPFLNRRLFGLKLINDLLKRSFSTKSFPLGISKSITQSNSSSSSSSTSTSTSTSTQPVYGPQLPPSYGTAVTTTTTSVLTNNNNSNTIQTIGAVFYSYSYIPINYFYSTHQICQILLDNNLIEILYQNTNDIHESIISRSSPILIAFANENLLTNEILENLIMISLSNQQQLDILKLFSDFIKHLSLSSMEFLLSLLGEKLFMIPEYLEFFQSSSSSSNPSDSFDSSSIVLNSSSVGALAGNEEGNANSSSSPINRSFPLIEPIVDIIYTIGITTRNRLLNIDSHPVTNLAYLQTDEIYQKNSYENILLKLHEKVLFLLFSWTNEKNHQQQPQQQPQQQGGGGMKKNTLIPLGNQNVLQYSIDKLESLMETGFTPATILDKNFHFPFHRHYLRMNSLLEYIFTVALPKKQAIYSSIKIMTQYLYSWPSMMPKGVLYNQQEEREGQGNNNNNAADPPVESIPMEIEDENQSPDEKVEIKKEEVEEKLTEEPTNSSEEKFISSSNWKDFIPFHPNRYYFMEYLISKYSIYSLLTNLLLACKEEFAKNLQEFNQIYSNNNNISIKDSSYWKIFSTKFSYFQQLDNIFEYFYLIFRSIEKQFFPKQEIFILWKAFIFEANIHDEFDLFLLFFSKLPNRIVEGSSNTSTSSSSSSATVTTASVLQSILKKDTTTTTTTTTSSSSSSSTTNKISFFDYNKEDYISLFQETFCSFQPENTSSSSSSSSILFFQSNYFNMKSYKCFEKWFRWINNECHYLIDTTIKDKILSVSIDPSKLLGIDCFLFILFHSSHEMIATQAVNFITHLLQVATYSMEFRNKLLTDCVTQLKLLRQQIIEGNQSTSSSSTSSSGGENMKINRILLLFNGILDESYHNQAVLKRKYDKNIPHNQCIEGNMITFKISSSSQKIKHLIFHLNISMNTKVSELIQEISLKYKNLTNSELKFFRQGKEIHLHDYINKTIGHFPNLMDKETIIVVEKPHVKISVANAATESKEDESKINTTTTSSGEQKDIENGLTSSSVISLPKKDPKKLFRTSLVKRISQESDIYYRLLLDLLINPSSLTVNYIDDIWNALMQLPTSFDYLMKWLKLDCSHVSELLPFSFEKIMNNVNNHEKDEKDENIWMKNHFCELLYHLQIIEILLHPSITSIQDILRQYNDYYYDLDGTDNKMDQYSYSISIEEMNCFGIENYLELYQNWYERFIQKNGISFLISLFHYLSRILSNPFIGNHSNGLSYRIILIGSRLITKLLRFFLIQFAYFPSILSSESNEEEKEKTKATSSSSPLTLKSYQLLLSFYFQYEANSIFPVTTWTNIMKNRPNFVPESLTSTNMSLLIPAMNEITFDERKEILTKLIASEWGSFTLMKVFPIDQPEPQQNTKNISILQSILSAFHSPLATANEGKEQSSSSSSSSSSLSQIYYDCLYLLIHFMEIDLLHRDRLENQANNTNNSTSLPAADNNSSATSTTSSTITNSSTYLKSMENFEKQILFVLFKDLLFLWSLSSLLSPINLLSLEIPYQILPFPQSSSASPTDNNEKNKLMNLYETLISCGISGNYVHLVENGLISYDKKKNFIPKTPLMEWFSAGLLQYLDWIVLFSEVIPIEAIESYQLQLNYSTEHYPASFVHPPFTYGTVLFQRIFMILLNKRPSIEPIYPSGSNLPPTAASSSSMASISHDSKKILFNLLVNTFTLCEKYNFYFISIQQWRTITITIFKELQSLIPLLQSKEIVSLNYLEGNMNILSSLVKTNDTMLHSFFITHLIPFFLSNLLEITPNDCILPIDSLISHGKKKRIITKEICDSKYLYEILSLILSKHVEHSKLLFLHYLQPIHKFLSLSENYSLLLSPISYDYSIEKESAKYNFVGLRNLGSTCYMNSLLQILFMNPSIRNYFIYELNYDYYYLQENENENENISIRSDRIDELKNDLGFQLQKVFLYLEQSAKKFYIPTDFTFAFKDETGRNPMNVLYQQDAQEFFLSLCHRIEENIHFHQKNIHQKQQEQEQQPESTEEADKKKKKQKKEVPKLPIDIFQLTLGCKICDQRFVAPSSTPGATTNNNSNETTTTTTTAATSLTQQIQENIQKYGIRESEENAVCVSLSLTNCSNLEESLSKFVEGEKINDYIWDENKKHEKVTIMKKQCLSEISNTIIFHLQRFTLNFDTFLREKMNDSFAFPKKLNMKKFMKEFQETAIIQEEDGKNGMIRDESYYHYELVGVIVHTGTSDSGHYFAYIKDQSILSSSATAGLSKVSTQSGGIKKSSEQQEEVWFNEDLNNNNSYSDDLDENEGHWYEFNDSEIFLFDPKTQLEKECFGGKSSIPEYIPSTQTLVFSESTNPKNAYMIIYNRIIPFPLYTSPQSSSSSSSTTTVAENSNKVISSKLLNQISKQIQKENHLTILLSKLMSKEYFTFLYSLFYFMFDYFHLNPSQQYSDKQTIYTLFYQLVKFWNSFITHSSCYEECKNFTLLVMDAMGKIDSFYAQENKKIAQLTSSAREGIRSVRNLPDEEEDEEEQEKNKENQIHPAAPVALAVAADNDKKDKNEETTDVEEENREKKVSTSFDEEKEKKKLKTSHPQDTSSTSSAGGVLQEMDVKQFSTTPMEQANNEEDSSKENRSASSNHADAAEQENVRDLPPVPGEQATAAVLPPPPPTKEEEKQSQQPQQQQQPAVPTNYHYLSRIILRLFNENIESILNNLLIPSKEELRHEIASFYSFVFNQEILHENNEKIIQYLTNNSSIDLDYGTIVTSMSLAAPVSTAMVVHGSSSANDNQNHENVKVISGIDEDEMDEDLALAIKLSQEQDAGAPVNTTATTTTTAAAAVVAEAVPMDVEEGNPHHQNNKNQASSLSVTAVEAMEVIDFTQEEESIPPPPPSSSPTQEQQSSAVAIGDDLIDVDDPDLALAIQLSKESLHSSVPSSAPPAVAAVASAGSATTTSTNNNKNNTAAGTNESIYSHFQSIPEDSIKFLCLLTLDRSLQYLIENWRKSESFGLLFLQMMKTNRFIRCLFIKRNFISSIIDMMMGDQSPLNGKLYFQSTSTTSSTTGNQANNNRKRCPSSFVAVHYMNKEKLLSSNTKHLPDWTNYIEILGLLVNECEVRPSFYSSASYYYPSAPMLLTPSSPLSSLMKMSEWDYLCLTNKTFYSICFKQIRYFNHPNFIQMIMKFSYENLHFTNMINEIIQEEMSIMNIENIFGIFELLESLMNLQDSLQRHRYQQFFGLRPNIYNPTNNNNNNNNTNMSMGSSLLELMFMYVSSILNIPANNSTTSSSSSSSSSSINYGHKSFVIIVFIRSFLHLLLNNRFMFEQLTYSTETVYNWSLWMYQFLLFQLQKYQAVNAYMEMAAHLHQNSTICPTTSTSTSTSTSTTGTTANNNNVGPFLKVFGEEFPEESEISWKYRIEKTIQLFSTLLVGWEIVDMNRYVLPPHLLNNANNNNNNNSNNNNNNNSHPISDRVTEFTDGMTDEELAKYISEAFPEDHGPINPPLD